MCGIVGLLSYGDAGRVDRSVLDRMRDAMAHRGPDGGDGWVSDDRKIGLGHRRLSIVDLNVAATQPMRNEDGTVIITFNGEIYNHAKLRPELVARGHKFRTDHSDTEVLVHGYEEWGLDGLLERIEGDYAFGIWDERKGLLSLARDRIGVKPLYFAWIKGCFAFASEMKALVEHPDFVREIDTAAMYHYLSFLTTPAPLTMMRGIYKLPAGCSMTIDRSGKATISRYWDAVPGRGIDPGETANLSEAALEEFYVSGIRDRLRASVEKRMMSDVPMGVFLSGGVDSSTNVALMSEFSSRPVETFTIGFSDYKHLNEYEQANQIARQFGTNHHEIGISKKDMINYLPQMLHSQDEPIADWVCIPLYFVSKLAHDNGMKVVQVGEGSDEQFCGYSGYMTYLKMYHKYWAPFRKYLPQPAQRLAAGTANLLSGIHPKLPVYADVIDRAARSREHFWSGAMVFPDLMKSQLVDSAAIAAANDDHADAAGLLDPEYLKLDSFNIVRSFMDPLDAKFPNLDPLTRMIHSEFRLRLPELLLMRVDKIGMSESLEARVPFLDHKLVEFSMDIPEEWKTKGGEPKYLLKKAVEGLIPDNIIYRKKMGFGAPMSDWMRSDFGRAVRTSVFSSGLMRRGFLNASYIEKLFDWHFTGRTDTSLYLWAIYNLTAWYDLWIDRKAVDTSQLSDAVA
ncbi:asparagine synthase (glutamine-hydrolyzing) [Bradyrhizobium sp. I1.8.5]|uniref:asparagine synthase (glutamine-hydrolyzing) n=1 Tax=unclassified Bradyrhizobium TaxID=2631580 RepID=UPI0007C8967C|nr:asparagine synthase (glutamine-hydrolyzing) [Bradyrhizobium sp.]